MEFSDQERLTLLGIGADLRAADPAFHRHFELLATGLAREGAPCSRATATGSATGTRRQKRSLTWAAGILLAALLGVSLWSAAAGADKPVDCARAWDTPSLPDRPWGAGTEGEGC